MAAGDTGMIAGIRGTMRRVKCCRAERDWYKNVLKVPTIRLAAERAQLTARATPIPDPAEVSEILDKFRAKYGARDVAAYYPKQDAALDVRLA
jgi:hypothetical protein